MRCTDARELLLEADLAELKGTADTDLSRHIRDCGRCSAMAERIVAEEAALGVKLGAHRPRMDVDQAIARAAVEAESRGKVLHFPRLNPAWGLVPLGAAAALAGVLLTQNGGQLPGEPIDLAAVRAGATAPAVEAAEGQNVAVFETDNPDIVVVWIF